MGGWGQGRDRCNQFLEKTDTGGFWGIVGGEIGHE